MTLKTHKSWSNGFCVIWYFSDEDGSPRVEKAATHISIIYECSFARVDDPRNDSRSYMIIPKGPAS